jgi:hypothetical protein
MWIPFPCDTCAYSERDHDPAFCIKGLTGWWGNIYCPEYLDEEFKDLEDFNL